MKASHRNDIRGAASASRPVQLRIETWRLEMGGRVRSLSVRACLLSLAALALAVPSSAQSPAEIQQAVDAAYAKFRTLNEGKNAD